MSTLNPNFMYDSIRKKVISYKEVLDTIEENRILWQKTTKYVILETLKGVTNAINLNWYAGANDYYKNLEVVYLTFGEQPSGISKMDETQMLMFTEIGGALLFNQKSDGLVKVKIQYPKIESIQSSVTSEKELDILRPEDITPDTILEYVETFLDELLEWRTEDWPNKKSSQSDNDDWM